MRKLTILFLLLLVGCGNPTAPVLSQVSPATLTAPTFYENSGTQSFTLTGVRLAPGAVVLFGETSVQPITVTSTSVDFNVPPSVVNPDFPQNPSSQTVILVRVMNPNGQISNMVGVTVVPHCNPCGT